MRSVGMILAVAFKPRYMRTKEYLVASATADNRRHATSGENGNSMIPALKGRAKLNRLSATEVTPSLTVGLLPRSSPTETTRSLPR